MFEGPPSFSILHVSGNCSLHKVLQEVGFSDQMNYVPNALCLDSRCFCACACCDIYKLFSIALCISVSEGACALRDGKILHVSGNCNLREVLQEVGFSDRVDVLSVRTASLGLPDPCSTDSKSSDRRNFIQRRC